MFWAYNGPFTVIFPTNTTNRLAVEANEPAVFFGRGSEDANTWNAIVPNYFAIMQRSPQKKVEAAHDWWTAYL